MKDPTLPSLSIPLTDGKPSMNVSSSPIPGGIFFSDIAMAGSITPPPPVTQTNFGPGWWMFVNK